MAETHPNRISDQGLVEVRKALERYQVALEASPLKLTVKAARYAGAKHFVDWLAHRYTPGQGRQ